MTAADGVSVGKDRYKAVDDGYHLGTCDGGVGLEGAVAVAVYKSRCRCGNDGVVILIGGVNVGKGYIVLCGKV